MKHLNRFIRFATLSLILALCGVAVAEESKPATAIFAGGCFWCVEADFDKVPGVLATESGYAGGSLKNPTYEQVSRGGTGHAESVRVTSVKDRQFCDIGNQYRTAIFYQDDAQRRAAEASKSALEKSGRLANVYTEIAPAGTFYPAEEYHQDYYKKNPIRYKYYRTTCGRDSRVAEVWGKKD